MITWLCEKPSLFIIWPFLVLPPSKWLDTKCYLQCYKQQFTNHKMFLQIYINMMLNKDTIQHNKIQSEKSQLHRSHFTVSYGKEADNRRVPSLVLNVRSSGDVKRNMSKIHIKYFFIWWCWTKCLCFIINQIRTPAVKWNLLLIWIGSRKDYWVIVIIVEVSSHFTCPEWFVGYP